MRDGIQSMQETLRDAPQGSPKTTIKNGTIVVGPDGTKFRVVKVISKTERNRKKRRRQKLRGSMKNNRKRRTQ